MPGLTRYVYSESLSNGMNPLELLSLSQAHAKPAACAPATVFVTTISVRCCALLRRGKVLTCLSVPCVFPPLPKVNVLFLLCSIKGEFTIWQRAVQNWELWSHWKVVQPGFCFLLLLSSCTTWKNFVDYRYVGGWFFFRIFLHGTIIQRAEVGEWNCHMQSDCNFKVISWNSRWHWRGNGLFSARTSECPLRPRFHNEYFYNQNLFAINCYRSFLNRVHSQCSNRDRRVPRRTICPRVLICSLVNQGSCESLVTQPALPFALVMTVEVGGRPFEESALAAQWDLEACFSAARSLFIYFIYLFSFFFACSHPIWARWRLATVIVTSTCEPKSFATELREAGF